MLPTLTVICVTPTISLLAFPSVCVKVSRQTIEILLCRFSVGKERQHFRALCSTVFAHPAPTCFKIEVTDVVDYKLNRRHGIVDVGVLLHTVDALSVVRTFGKLRFVHCVVERARYRSAYRKVGKLLVGMHKLQEEFGNVKVFAVGIDKTVTIVLRHKRLLGVRLVGSRLGYGHKTELTSSLGFVGIAFGNKVEVGCSFVFPPHAVHKHGVYRGTKFVCA